MMTPRKPLDTMAHSQRAPPGRVELAPSALCTQVFVLSQTWGCSPAFAGQGGDPSLPGPQVNCRLVELIFGFGTWGQALSKG